MSNEDAPDDPDVRYRFDHDRRAPARARAELDRVLTDPDDPIADDVRLAASELVTNVISHTIDGGELRAWDPQPDVPLRIEVEDNDPEIPAIPNHSPAVGGHGLRIVDAVADDWGIDTAPTGKTVWAEFNRDLRTRTSETGEAATGGEPADTD